MAVFRLSTYFTFEDDDLGPFRDEAISNIAKILDTEEMYVTLDIEHSMRKITRDDNSATKCDVIYFGDELWSEMMKDDLSKACFKLEHLMEHLFVKHKLLTRYISYTDKVLIDWSERSKVVSCMPVEDQGQRRNCWAYVAAFLASCTYAHANPSVKDLAKIRTSPQDLSDWVYCFQDLKKYNVHVDKHGYYGCDASSAFNYMKSCGVPLLENYPIEEFKERSIETEFDINVFIKSWHGRGERILIDSYHVTEPDTVIFELGSPLFRKPGYTIELVTRILHDGVAYGSIFYCGGCELCDGFDRFDGRGVYDEPVHPVNHGYKRHSVAVLGAGNLEGKDYVRILNTRGPDWARNGQADMHIKFFSEFSQVSGARKKVVGAQYLT